MSDDGRHHDAFHPPAIPILVHCLRCQEEYDSWRIQWVPEPRSSDTPGSWCCPTPGCDGTGFGLDIFPVDSDDLDRHGASTWVDEDDDLDDELWDEVEALEAWDQQWIGDDQALDSTNGHDADPADVHRRDDDEELPF